MKKRRRTISLLLDSLCVSVLSFVFGALGAQTLPPPPAHRFEVAVIRPSRSTSTDVWLIPEAHGFRAQNVVVWQLVENAYYLRDQQLEGGPAWIKTDRYDINAKADEVGAAPPETALSPLKGTAGNLDRNRQRLQALLRDRFGLVLRTETRVGQYYSLQLSKSGNKMEVAGDRDGDPVVRMGRGRLAMTTDMKGITAMLTDIVGPLVIDETGLTGYYNVKLEWMPDVTGMPVSARTTDTAGTPEAGDVGPSIFTAVKEQLGLQLVPKKGPVPVFVIEKIERPSEN